MVLLCACAAGLVAYERLVPDQWFMDTVTVSGDSSEYDISFTILNCEHDLPLLAVANARVSVYGTSP